MRRSNRISRLVRPALVSAVALSLWGALTLASAGASADPPADALPPLVPGEVVSLFGGRPELWVADDRGQLHFAGDTRALAGRPVDWSFRLQVSPQQLQTLEL